MASIRGQLHLGVVQTSLAFQPQPRRLSQTTSNNRRGLLALFSRLSITQNPKLLMLGSPHPGPGLPRIFAKHVVDGLQ